MPRGAILVLSMTRANASSTALCKHLGRRLHVILPHCIAKLQLAIEHLDVTQVSNLSAKTICGVKYFAHIWTEGQEVTYNELVAGAR
jgi:hypothetical protein